MALRSQSPISFSRVAAVATVAVESSPIMPSSSSSSPMSNSSSISHASPSSSPSSTSSSYCKLTSFAFVVTSLATSSSSDKFSTLPVSNAVSKYDNDDSFNGQFVTGSAIGCGSGTASPNSGNSTSFSETPASSKICAA